MSTSKQPSAERKAALTQLCDAESYVVIIRESLTPEQAKLHAPIHMANVMSLAAELYLQYYDGIGRAFEVSSELVITFTAKISRDKDVVEIAYLPVAKFKDSASATVEEDDNQPDLGNIKKEAKGRAPKPVKPAPLGLPAPTMALPAPELTEDEKADIEAVRQAGVDARAEGSPSSANPHPLRSVTRAIWKEGWTAEDRRLKAGKVVEAEVVEPSEPAGEVTVVDDEESLPEFLRDQLGEPDADDEVL